MVITVSLRSYVTSRWRSPMPEGRLKGLFFDHGLPLLSRRDGAVSRIARALSIASFCSALLGLITRFLGSAPSIYYVVSTGVAIYREEIRTLLVLNFLHIILHAFDGDLNFGLEVACVLLKLNDEIIQVGDGWGRHG